MRARYFDSKASMQFGGNKNSLVPLSSFLKVALFQLLGNKNERAKFVEILQRILFVSIFSNFSRNFCHIWRKIQG